MAKTSLKVKQKRLWDLHREGTGSKRLAKKGKTKFYNRCHLCGRTHSFMREYNCCRVCFRNYARKGLIMGVRKASW